MFQHLWTVHLKTINWLSGIKQLAIKPPVQLQIKPKHRFGFDAFHRSHTKKYKWHGTYWFYIYRFKQGALYTEACADPEKKPSLTGIKGVKYELFQNYLFNRKQTVIYDGVASNPHYVFSDIPQGSIIGPLLLFIAYEGLNEVLIRCQIIIYADDTVIYTSGESFSTIKSNLTRDF